MTAPSRQFLVQQAVLNAMQYWSPFYARVWMIGWDAERNGLPPKFRDQINVEFRKLAARYGA